MARMAAAAIGRSAVPRTRLALAPARRGSRPRSSARSDQYCRHLFNLACIAMLGVAIFALARVTLAANAAATAIEAGRLNSAIKAERLVGDLLECDKSALTTPSRIECIAGESLQMAEAPQVSYMHLVDSSSTSTRTGEPAAAPAGDADSDPTSVAVDDSEPGRLSGMLASVMEMAAGEAELLLVGDAGLASTR